jgi:hypothetical protein
MSRLARRQQRRNDEPREETDHAVGSHSSELDLRGSLNCETRAGKESGAHQQTPVILDDADVVPQVKLGGQRDLTGNAAVRGLGTFNSPRRVDAHLVTAFSNDHRADAVPRQRHRQRPVQHTRGKSSKVADTPRATS